MIRAPRRRVPARRTQGFSLLEVLMAFALLTVGLGILVAILGGGVAGVNAAYFLDKWSSTAQPTRVALRDAAGDVAPGEDEDATQGHERREVRRWRQVDALRRMRRGTGRARPAA